MSDFDDVVIKTKSKTRSLVGVLLIIVAIGLYVFLIRPLSDEVEIAQARIFENNNKISELKESLQGYETAQSELDISTEVKIAQVNKSIPKGLNQDQVIEDLTDIADEYKMSVNSMSFGSGSSPKEGIGTLRVNASFEGSYTELIGFLEGLEQNARLFEVRNISVQVTSFDITDFKRANFSLAIDTFYRE